MSVAASVALFGGGVSGTTLSVSAASRVLAVGVAVSTTVAEAVDIGFSGGVGFGARTEGGACFDCQGSKGGGLRADGALFERLFHPIGSVDVTEGGEQLGGGGGGEWLGLPLGLPLMTSVQTRTSFAVGVSRK